MLQQFLYFTVAEMVRKIIDSIIALIDKTVASITVIIPCIVNIMPASIYRALVTYSQKKRVYPKVDS